MMHAARQALEYAATALGFSGMGVAAASLPQGDYLQQWLDAGMHADMEWMQRHLPARLNPELVLPGVRSVIILTYEYAGLDSRRQAGRIARYAQGEDYHKLLASKLADLDETLQFYGGAQRCFTDSGPVSERFFAMQSGLGWIGRNGLLIRPGKGSYCFLASILTTLELPVSTPMSNHCGKCHRCEQACPTQALNNGCCDARRCLSYWTIESKQSDMPPDIATALRDRLYGCDICQEVCPWNQLQRGKARRVDSHLLMPATLAHTPLQELEMLREEDFNSFFAQSPIRRIGEKHLKLNIRHLETDSENDF